jgi:hypothetical protein
MRPRASADVLPLEFLRFSIRRQTQRPPASVAVAVSLAVKAGDCGGTVQGSHTGQTASQKRPAVVVSAAVYQQRRPDVIVMLSRVRFFGRPELSARCDKRLARRRTAEGISHQTRHGHDSLIPSIVAHAIINVPRTPLWQGMVLTAFVIGAAIMARRGAAVVAQVFSGASAAWCIALAVVGTG